MMKYDLNELIQGNSRDGIYIFGAGRYGHYLCDYLAAYGINISGFCDNHMKEYGSVISLQEVLLSSKNPVFVIGVIDERSKIEIIDQLKCAGIELNNVIVPLQTYNQPFFDMDILYSDYFGEQLLNMQWENARHNNRIKKYFESNDLWRVGAVGAIELIERLMSDLQDSSVCIERECSDLEELLDAIVVVDHRNYPVIEEEFMKKNDCPIINIWSVLIA